MWAYKINSLLKNSCRHKRKKLKKTKCFLPYTRLFPTWKVTGFLMYKIKNKKATQPVSNEKGEHNVGIRAQVGFFAWNA